MRTKIRRAILGAAPPARSEDPAPGRNDRSAKCCGCGEEFPGDDGPTHPYVLSSPGCWKAYGDLLAREYQDQSYWPVHRLTVDSYAVQHPGVDTPQARNSVGIHLSRLCLMLEMAWPMQRVNGAMEEITARKSEYPWLTPPAFLGDVTVRHVLAARNASEHADEVERWARSVWAAWAGQHAAVREWVGTLSRLR